MSDIIVAGPKSVSPGRNRSLRATCYHTYVPVWEQTAVIWWGIAVDNYLLATTLRCSLQDTDESVVFQTSLANRTCEGVSLYMISNFGKRRVLRIVGREALQFQRQ